MYCKRLFHLLRRLKALYAFHYLGVALNCTSFKSGYVACNYYISPCSEKKGETTSDQIPTKRND